MTFSFGVRREGPTVPTTTVDLTKKEEEENFSFTPGIDTIDLRAI